MRSAHVHATVVMVATSRCGHTIFINIISVRATVSPFDVSVCVSGAQSKERPIARFFVVVVNNNTYYSVSSTLELQEWGNQPTTPKPSTIRPACFQHTIHT